MKGTTEPELRLNCIRMKRDIQAEISKETRGLSLEERLLYYRRLAAESPFMAHTQKPGRVPRKKREK
jgi:hypothetical protein